MQEREREREPRRAPTLFYLRVGCNWVYPAINKHSALSTRFGRPNCPLNGGLTFQFKQFCLDLCTRLSCRQHNLVCLCWTLGFSDWLLNLVMGTQLITFRLMNRSLILRQKAVHLIRRSFILGELHPAVSFKTLTLHRIR